MRIYVASSWRNEYQRRVVANLRVLGHEVYDFRNPEGGTNDLGGFRWHEMDPHWKTWTPQQYVEALDHPVAMEGFTRDYSAMRRSEACVMVMPCGVSAAIEAGFMQGLGRPTVCYVPVLREPDLMVNIFDLVTTEWTKVVDFLRRPL